MIGMKNNFLNPLLVLITSILLIACTLPGRNDGGPRLDPNQTVKVALLVPKGAASSNLSQLGSHLENAAKLALAEHNTAQEIELLVYATAGNDAQAAKMAAQAQADGASLIIGPLKSTEAAVVANTVSVPVLSFSNNSEIAMGNTYILGSSFFTIADRVISYAKGTGASALGIVATQDIAGTQGAAAANQAASNNGMPVVSRQTYPLSLGGIQSAAPKIAANLKSTGANTVFFTDTPTAGLGHLTNAMANSGYTSQSAKYLGLSRWDSSDSTMAQANLEGGLFALPDPKKTESFNSRYSGKYGAKPHALAGLAYDGVLSSILMVRRARSSGDNTPFGDDNIRKLSVNGSMGAFRFNKANQAERAMAIMQVRGGQAVIVSQAPQSK